MAKFYGKIGYGITKKDDNKKGVYTNQIVEKDYYGEIRKNSRRIQSSGQVNDNIVVSNVISIIADSFANENLGNMLYVQYMGSKWKISSADIEYPRINLTIGDVYNG